MTTKLESSETAAALAKTLIFIHFVDGNKGGVGKSFCCRTLYQWFLDHQQPVTGVEADVDSPDFHDIYEEVQLAQFSEDEALGARANIILNLAAEQQQPVVVNLPATVHGRFRRWMTDFNVFEGATENHIQFVKWFVITGEYDSLKSLENSLKTFGQQIPHVVVRNLKYSEWDFFEEAETVQALIQKHQAQVIDLPKLPLRVASTMLDQRLTFGAARTYKGKRFGLVEQSAVKGYLRSAYTQFEATGFLPS